MIAGLQAYLDNTNRLGKARVVGVNRSTNEYDFEFVDRYKPPYLLHIALACLEENDYGLISPDIYEAFLTDKQIQQPFVGSDFGHTVAIYEKEHFTGSNDNIALKLHGASGLKRSRNADNKRNCDKTFTWLLNDEKCIHGITYIELENDSDGLSTGAIVGIAVGAVFVAVGSGVLVYKKWPLNANKNLYAQFI